MEKESRLVLAQVDHVTGEVLGFAVDRIMEMGANNVQLIPTITKKSRPGNIIIIDVAPSLEDGIADFLANELKISGYHRINTSHVFHKVSFVEKAVNIHLNGRPIGVQCKFKVIGEPSSPVAVDVEHDFLVELQRVISDHCDRYTSLEELRRKIELSFDAANDQITVIL